MSIYELALQGRHNWYNSMAAAIAGSVLDLKKETIRESLMDFQNLEHRLEMVTTIRNVKYINDSKATNVNSTWYAMEYIDGPVVWIAGGVDKGNEYEMLDDLVKEKVKAIVCLGNDNRHIHASFAHLVDVIVNTNNMASAVKMAQHLADSEGTVLLSPACASFDLFKDYQDRGHQFKRTVRAL